MTSSKTLLAALQKGEQLSKSDQIRLILTLSWPAIMAQLSVTLMQLIDAGMAGRLGTGASASIGVVSSTTWLMNGFLSGFVYAFSVQTAQAIGARKNQEARNLCRQGLYTILVMSLIFAAAGYFMSFHVPALLGADPEIRGGASAYLGIFCLSLPFVQLNSWSVQMLQATGDTKLPGMVQIVMCFLDVFFNWIFIFLMNLGVAGAALGTAMAEVCAAAILLINVLFRNEWLKGRIKVHFSKHSILQAFKIGVPISVEQLIMGTSYVSITKIVSALGSVSVAANSFAITAESLCYMPAFGVQSAATALIGQCTGSGRISLAKTLSWRIERIAMTMMVFSGFVMFVFAGLLMSILSPDPKVIALGAEVLKMEAFAEPMYGAAIAANGILRGKGDTFWPAVINLISVWCIRIPLAAFLAGIYGLQGAWLAMVIELNCRGLFFLWRLRHAWKIPRNPQKSTSLP